jgi:hypothetical protein
MRTFTSRAIATGAAAAIALTISLQPAAAGSRHGNDAAAFAAFAAVFGTIAAIIAAEQYRDRPTHGYGYHPSYTNGPVYHRPLHHPHGPWRHRGHR